MNVKSKLVIIVAVALSSASPALAQSFTAREGTGNVLPFRYGPDGTRLGPSALAAQSAAAGVDRSGLYAFVPGNSWQPKDDYNLASHHRRIKIQR